jgi:hypothetical protein
MQFIVHLVCSVNLFKNLYLVNYVWWNYNV